jgi:alkylation response protein AidB-like acyl-CoA dehydrogenase
MTGYTAPLAEMRFVLEDVAGLADIAALPGYGEATPELVEAVLTEAARFAAEVLAPLNRPGDVAGAVIENGVVRTPEGVRQAYEQFVAAGWNSLPFDPKFGGQGLPWTLAVAVQEMWASANLAFSLCPLLTQAGVELLQEHGSPQQQAYYLPRLVTGEWAGTMNLTEPQAGTDLGAVRTRATREGNHYRIVGQKIFITYGEHDLADNIVHMVLARTPDAPAGVKGISLFVVPKYLPAADGGLGPRNDLRCVSLEKKLGIHASPTCVMAFGDNGGAIGYLVGEENRGLEYMFTMMNNARLAVGVQGLAVAERAWQQARAYARQRVQGRVIGDSGPAPILRHPDVRRMLMTMRTLTEAMRALVYFTAGALDRAKRHPEAEERERSRLLLELLIPVTKGWCTDRACEIASLGVQIHGGMGFIEETGAAQYYRDARITPIYEGTNGIQALDLVNRKLMRDEGAAAMRFIAGLRQTETELGETGDEGAAAIARALGAGIDALQQATEWLLKTYPTDARRAFVGASPYLSLFGTVAGGWLLAETALAGRGRAQSGEPGLATARMQSARFFADNIMPFAAALAAQVTAGGDSVLAAPDDDL